MIEPQRVAVEAGAGEGADSIGAVLGANVALALVDVLAGLAVGRELVALAAAADRALGRLVAHVLARVRLAGLFCCFFFPPIDNKIHLLREDAVRARVVCIVFKN